MPPELIDVADLGEVHQPLRLTNLPQLVASGDLGCGATSTGPHAPRVAEVDAEARMHPVQPRGRKETRCCVVLHPQLSTTRAGKPSPGEA
jgi:hypothetical protein